MQTRQPSGSRKASSESRAAAPDGLVRIPGRALDRVGRVPIRRSETTSQGARTISMRITKPPAGGRRFEEASSG